jgi:transposase
MFLDNLRLHHNKDLAAYAKSKDIHFLYNASYSPVYNGAVESLWALAKRNFSRECITSANFEDQDMICRLVTESIAAVPQTYLKKRVTRAYEQMKIVQNLS